MTTHFTRPAWRGLFVVAALALAGCSSAPLERRLQAVEAEHAALARGHAQLQTQLRDLSGRLSQAQAMVHQLDGSMRSYSTLNAAQVAQTQSAIGRLEADLRKAQSDAREAAGVVGRFRVMTTASGMKVVVAE